MKTLLLPLKLLIFNISRKLNKAFILPINYTYSITSKCDSKCKTCNIWKQKLGKDLTREEWKKIIKNIGNAPFWITITGGNQFLREDLSEIVGDILRYNRPKIINFPVSGTLPKLVVGQIKKILVKIKRKNIKLILNISIDGISELHDYIRGAKGTFKKTIKTVEELKKLQKKYPNLIISTYTIISKYNAKHIDKIMDFITNNLKPDHQGIEIAEKSKELFNTKENFVLSKNKSIKVLDEYINCVDNSKKPILKLKNFFRKKYYINIKKILLTNKEVIPCFAGIASIQISPNGQVWQCCIRADVMGDLRKEKYDFKKIFFGKHANKIRKKIKKEHCFCTHSNPYYTNILSSLKLQ